MRFQTSARCLTMLLVGLYLLRATMFATAQDDPPAPQFLYRNENQLVLLDGYTGEATALPFAVSEQDRFEWSPDGQYLLTRLYNSENRSYCLNLYDVDTQTWVYDQPIACGVGEAIFSADSTRIVYAASDEINGILWLYRLADKSSQELYRTTEGNEVNSAGIEYLKWSPTETYLTFVSYRWIMGGTVNALVIMNSKTHAYFSLGAGGGYYAHYSPIWSADDRWFLISLQEQYVTNASVPFTNHQGDVFLVNSETGDQYRLTYTPAVLENDVHWTDEGSIAFAVVIEQTLTIEQAQQVEVVPREAIEMPEPYDVEAFSESFDSVMVSPDNDLGAWVSSGSTPSEEHTNELNFGFIFSEPYTVFFSVPIPESYQFSNVLIGWRPSDYAYPQG